MTTSQFAKAQLNAADSLWFSQIFTDPKYADDSAFPGNWFIHDTITSTAELFTQLDSSFKFKMEDFNAIDSMVVNDTLFYDSVRNDTYNYYYFALQQTNPLVNIDFTLNGKSGRAYSFLYPKDSVSQSDYAFLVLPGGGSNEGTKLVLGFGYHNLLCYVTNNLQAKGDVYTYMKPNEDARAIYWNNLKLNSTYLVKHLDTLQHQYGVNYLAEIVATINFLKKKYCKVILLGLSEGGYSGLLASLYTHPDAAIISGGYAIGFDTSWNSYNVLQERFDSLIFTFHKDSVKNLIASNNTKYMFTWGNNDYVNLMQAEHDSNYTQNFLNDTIKCSYYYNYSLHTFPQCTAIDSFAEKILGTPELRFMVSDTTNPDSLIALVTTCSNASYSFDLFRNDTFFQSYNNIYPDTLITLIDSGMYYLRNIVSINGDSSICTDTIIFNKITPVTPEGIRSFANDLKIQYNNPVNELLQIKIISNKSHIYDYRLYDLFGTEKFKARSGAERINIDMHNFPSGIYFIKVSNGADSYTGKVIKL